MQKRNQSRSDAGMALFVALVLLLVFSMLGTAYVRYMSVNLDSTRQSVQKLRGKHLGQSGVYAAIGEIEAARSNSESPASVYEFSMPMYRLEQAEDGEGLARSEYPQTVTATVEDESGRVNLNFAQESVLIALGVPSEVIAARKARDFKRFVSLDDLRSRDFMNSQEFNALDKSTLTVFTGDRDGASVNLNAASPKVLAAIFNIELAEAEGLAAKRPFASWDDVLQKVGREPSTFRIAATGQGAMPAGLSLESDCYRILSTASMKTPDTSLRGMHVDVEAVVYFDDESFAIRFWTESPVNVTLERDTEGAAEIIDELMGDTPDTEGTESVEEVPAEDSEETADDAEESAEASIE